MNWKGKDGKKYTDRNIVDYKGRIPFFDKILPRDIENVLEVGCNRGHNLKAIAEARGYNVQGKEINEYAANIARKQGITVNSDATFPYNLVLFSGVLIHQNPLDLVGFITKYTDKNYCKYILIIEHKTDSIQTINTRWYKNAFWTMNFGKELKERLTGRRALNIYEQWYNNAPPHTSSVKIIKSGYVNGKKPKHDDFSKPLEEGQVWHDLDYFWLMELS